MIERTTWLKEKRRLAEECMDTLFAPIYDDNWGSYINDTHRAFLNHLLDACPPGCTILDAACGTGKYWPIILASGRAIYGIDQSQQMLLKAQAKFPGVTVEKLGMQEMRFVEAFDGIICVDAMEFVFPEDWPVVLENFRRALKPAGRLYFTVELLDEEEIRAAFSAGQQLGLPLVEGEHAHEGGYHYYPPIAQIRRWTHDARFDILEEAVGDGCHHFLVRKAAI